MQPQMYTAAAHLGFFNLLIQNPGAQLGKQKYVAMISTSFDDKDIQTIEFTRGNYSTKLSPNAALVIFCGYLPTLPIVEKILSKHPQVINDCTVFTPLEFACRKGNFDIVRYLLSNGADVHTGCPVLWAAYTNHIQIVKYLVEECGADFEKRNPNDQSAIQYAAENGSTDAVKYLIEEKGVSTKPYIDHPVLKKICWGPKCSNSNTKACSGCNVARYCSATCQKPDWSQHKLECKQLKIQFGKK